MKNLVIPDDSFGVSVPAHIKRRSEMPKTSQQLHFIKPANHVRSPKQNRRFSGKANPPGLAEKTSAIL